MLLSTSKGCKLHFRIEFRNQSDGINRQCGYEYPDPELWTPGTEACDRRVATEERLISYHLNMNVAEHSAHQALARLEGFWRSVVAEDQQRQEEDEQQSMDDEAGEEQEEKEEEETAAAPNSFAALDTLGKTKRRFGCSLCVDTNYDRRSKVHKHAQKLQHPKESYWVVDRERKHRK